MSASRDRGVSAWARVASLGGVMLFVLGSGACGSDGDSNGDGGKGGSAQAGTGATNAGSGAGSSGSGGGGGSGGTGSGSGASGGSGGTTTGGSSGGGGQPAAGGAAGGSGGSGSGGAPPAGGGTSAGGSGGGMPPGATDGGLSPYTVQCDEMTPCPDQGVTCLGVFLAEGGNGFTCSNQCQTAADCSDAPSGTDAEAGCVQFTAASRCVLVCSENGVDRQCPAGMTCYHYPDFPIAYCLWL